jgi:uncharacterized protein (TIGR02145 family)
MDPVKIVMSTGTIEWAPFNLSGYQTFAENPSDYGALFQWGYDTAQPAADSSNPVTNWQTTESPNATWHDGQGPCPAGWRLPTLAEANNLMNLAATNTSTGGLGIPSGTWTIITYTTGASGGAVITPKAGDTSKTLFFSNTGYRNSSGPMYQGGESYIWTSTPVDGTSSMYRFTFSSSSGFMYYNSKLLGFSVRCVRTVE